MRAGMIAWTHHPRGGIVIGMAGPLQPGLYAQERKVGTFSCPAPQCHPLESLPDQAVIHSIDKPACAELGLIHGKWIEGKTLAQALRYQSRDGTLSDEEWRRHYERMDRAVPVWLIDG